MLFNSRAPPALASQKFLAIVSRSRSRFDFSNKGMAYAAVVSLMSTIKRLINPTNQKITRYVFQKLNSLRVRETLKRLDGGRKRIMDRKVIRNDWSMIDVLNGKNYRNVDWSMISTLFDGSNRSNSRGINRSVINALHVEIRNAVWKLMASISCAVSLSPPPPDGLAGDPFVPKDGEEVDKRVHHRATLHTRRGRGATLHTRRGRGARDGFVFEDSELAGKGVHRRAMQSIA